MFLGGETGRMRTDAIVVGGGPAGLYTAQQLARRGLGVHVLEEHERIGEPVHCTGILGTEAFGLPGVPRDGVLASPDTVQFHSPTGHRLVYQGGEGQVCVIDRGRFDRSLAEAAMQAGATLTLRARAVHLAPQEDGVFLDALIDGRPTRVAAQVCVLACGARYRFQRALGWGVPALFLGSAQTEVDSAGKPEVDVFLRSDLAPRGFAWRVPIDRDGRSRAKVGVMASSASRRVLGHVLDELATDGQIAGSSAPVVARLLPLAPIARTYGDRVLAVGDAAGLVKPTTGGGIYYSLLSAEWGAAAVGSAFDRGDFSARTLRTYEEMWRARLGLELRVGVWFRRLAEWLTAGDLDTLTQLAITDGLLPVVRASARFNWHHDLILQSLRHPGVLQIVLRRFLEGMMGGGPCAPAPG
jgi:digeranylgeranylglycerophospholipid reductase